MIDSLRRGRHGALRCFATLVVALAICSCFAAPAVAQRPTADTTRAAVPDSIRLRADSGLARPGPTVAGAQAGVARDTAIGPPISPKRAGIYSLLVPGLGQAKLDRPIAAAVFVSIEVFSIAMARKAGYDLRLAKQHQNDSIPESFEFNSDGTIKLDSSGNPVIVYARNRYAGNRVRARSTHYEDQIAGIIFNHLFAGADAFVAAQLWDLPAQVSYRPLDGGASAIVVSIAW